MSEIATLNLERERDLALLRQDTAEKSLASVESPASSFWLRWGFPLGLVVGLGAGVGAALAAAKGMKK